MDSLLGKHNVTAVRKVLAAIPSDLDGAYAKAIERIDRQNKDDRTLAKRMVAWLAFARRTISFSELQHGIAALIWASDMDPEYIIDEEILTSLTTGLVIIDDKRNTVSLPRECLPLCCVIYSVTFRRPHRPGILPTRARYYITRCRGWRRSNKHHICLLQCLPERSLLQ
jgi:hypothetical protein